MWESTKLHLVKEGKAYIFSSSGTVQKLAKRKVKISLVLYTTVSEALLVSASPARRLDLGTSFLLLPLSTRGRAFYFFSIFFQKPVFPAPTATLNVFLSDYHSLFRPRVALVLLSASLWTNKMRLSWCRRENTRTLAPTRRKAILSGHLSW